MPRPLTWQALGALTYAQLARAQLAIFHTLGDEIRLTDDDRRRALNLDDSTWTAWRDFSLDGPIPSEPPLPEMLRRLGETAFHLTVVAESRQDAA